MKSAAWQKARDDAFIKAAAEIRPDFNQCPRCSTWVCKKSCWNTQRGLCKNCAPDMGVEMAAAQASRTVEEIWAHSKVAEDDRAMLKDESWRAGVRATCPNCNAPLVKNVKFCPECGTAIRQTSSAPTAAPSSLSDPNFVRNAGPSRNKPLQHAAL